MSARRILVIDDEPGLRDALADRLKTEGFAVVVAIDGEQGLAKAIADQLDLILLDNRMPKMSGYEMLGKLREQGSWGAQVPVIFLTNIEMKSDDERDDIAAIHPSDYIIKSDTTLDAVIAKVRSHLS